MRMRTTRPSPSCVCSTTGERVPSGVGISYRFQRFTQLRVPADAPGYTRPMPPAVDTYGLGPLQTNCYVVRAERGAPEAVVVDPGGDAEIGRASCRERVGV